MSHNSLQNYLRTVFGLVHFHKYDPNWFENLVVYERDIYVTMAAEALSKD